VTGRRQYLGALLRISGGAGLALLAAVPVWITASVATPGLGTATFEVTGSQAAVGLVAVALVALAGSVAVVATGGRARQAVGVLVVLAGCAVVALAAVPGLRPTEAARGPVAASAGSPAGQLTTTGSLWWLLAVLGGLLVVSGGASTVRSGRAWPTMSARFERDGSARPATRQDPWAALDRGDDPTLDTGGPPDAAAARPDLPE
jgi:uncharacterized membrane protein (TIGR02234 family)